MHCPKSLFKYRPLACEQDLNHARQLLLEHKAKFSSARELDDPLELHVQIVPPREPARRAQYAKQTARRFGLQPACVEASLDSPTFIDRARREFHNAISEHITMFCTSDSCCIPKLWDLYASGGGGVCIELTTSVLFAELYPVQYTSDAQRPTLELDVLRSPESRKTAVSTKGPEWSYQREWRFVNIFKDQAPNPDFVQLPDETITGVILGQKTEPKNERKIVEWLREQSHPCQLWRIETPLDSDHPRRHLIDTYP